MPNLTYQDCVELKEAGFFQAGDGFALSVFDADLGNDDSPMSRIMWDRYIHDPKQWPNTVYEPTLSELIEGCGEGFTNLHYNGTGNRWDSWAASSWDEELGRNRYHAYGPTPEQAMKELWFALHK